MADMEKVYDPKQVEARLYENWEQKGYFHAEPNPEKEPFSIVMPPPNITGQLHMGHAMDNTMQDIMARFKRMQGYETLWLPGTDHASIATEVKVIEALKKEGLTKESLGREGFLERAWEWRDEYGGVIVKQLRKLGSSCDWERERFTMDEGCSKAVVRAFIDLYDRGLIYQGNRIINWCPHCETALSDAEVEYEEQDGFFWFIRYPAADGGEGVVIATTRPETLLGDSGVAVNPEDPRYQDLVGKTLILPLMNREIPVVADDYVDKEFGTGAVKMTPAHDPNDFEVGLRHNLEVIRVMNDDGTINDLGGPYAGLDRYEARKRIVEDLEKEGYLVKIEPHAHNVGSCYRCGTTVEPIVSKQWFVSMKPLAEKPIEAVRNGDVRFVPARFDKTYFNWMDNIRDWCISRQLWWGHRIPAYTCQDCGELVVAEQAPETCPKCGKHHFEQDKDVLDTWFSSGLWPFSTLGWPDKTPELEYFYPTTMLVTGYDIIFFWVARMIVFGYAEMGDKPFGDVLIHGLVRDGKGRKMSKSLGNGIDPLEVIDSYGADALRLSLVMGVAPGNDMRFYWEKVESCRNFSNKVWNASRFVLMNIEESGIVPKDIQVNELDISDRWMLTRLNRMIEEITAHLQDYDLGLAAQKLYDFIWSEFCDWYVEMAKSRLYGDDAAAKQAVISMLSHSLTVLLKLLHPIMPFLTEEIYQHLPHHDETIMRSPWPTAEAAFDFPEDAQSVEELMEALRAVRNLRADMNVPPSARPPMWLITDEARSKQFEATLPLWPRLAGAGEICVQTNRDGLPSDGISAVTPYCEVVIPLAELVDTKKEKARLSKEKERLEAEVARADAKLGNPGFTGKAPANVIEGVEKQRTESVEALQKINERLATMSE